jgi:hypothetical protein
VSLLLDTDICSAYLKGHNAVANQIETVKEDLKNGRPPGQVPAVRIFCRITCLVDASCVPLCLEAAAGCLHP